MGPPVLIVSLYFGQAIPGREDVTPAEWQAFLDQTVTTNLPNGYTLMDAHGAWMNPITHQTIKEATKVLIVAMPPASGSLVTINRVRSDYQVRFRQELVGMTTQTGCGAF